ncbi:hypothetical protein ACJ73_08569 [Blastomyces percursus]|uniref:Uncharacterized protein n=1 Tax=Blastomyces percursus TaxID=1658174 RepID=A0A1J9PW12_9EURO|nr:hypothetical protein ACJ73_08569 [Blastomyces percursus]
MATQINDLVDGRITFSVRAVPQNSASTAGSIAVSSSSLPPLGGFVQDLVEPGTGPGVESSSGPAGMTASLEDQGGSWRKGSSKEQMMFRWRKIIIDEIHTRESSGMSVSATMESIELIRQQGKLSLNKLRAVEMAETDLDPQSREVLALPGQDVVFVRGAITEVQVRSHRPSYINVLLIQSRGQPEPHACTACRDGPGFRPFPECRRVPGHFGGACGNCKWQDHAARCSVRDGGIEVIDLDDDDDDDEGGPQR